MMQTSDPTSLDNLYDIVSAPPVPFWPPAPGWYIVGGTLLVVLSWISWRAWNRWQSNAYRRAAISELATIRSQLQQGGTRSDLLASLATLLKRTALAAFPRDAVASLSGENWLQFLDRTGANDRFSRGSGRLVASVQYDPRAAARVTETEIRDLVQIADNWIRHHKRAIDPLTH